MSEEEPPSALHKSICTTGTTTTTTTTTTNVAAAAPSESDVYDRQIRLWGAESQAKMQKAKVLYLHVTGVSAEVLKNLVLAGIAATLCDPRESSSGVVVPHFFSNNHHHQHTQIMKTKFASMAHAVQPLVEELNPLLGTCPLLEKQISEITKDDLNGFSIIMASQIGIQEAVRLSQISNNLNIPFYVGDCFGMHGAAMIDLGGDHLEYRPEQGKQLLDPISLKEYYSLEQILVQVPLHECTNRFHKSPPPVWIQYRCLLEYQQQMGTWLPNSNNNNNKDLGVMKEFLQAQKVVDSLSDQQLTTLVQAGMAQIAPVCAVLGGVLGNEIIKVISGKGEPANNTLLFDGNLCKIWTFLVKPKEG